MKEKTEKEGGRRRRCRYPLLGSLDFLDLFQKFLVWLWHGYF
jgi:hypothetical protein